MNGAHALLHSLVNSGVRVCFANPGTSEMHFLAAIDDVPEMRMVLGLFEGVVTGAADGYARMTGRPAATLLHLGPGLANGMANLHNARRARIPLVNIVGDHATFHKAYDAPLNSDIVAAAGTVSSWVGSPAAPEEVAGTAAAAIAAAMGPPMAVATLILPADVSWSEGAIPASPVVGPPLAEPEMQRIEAAASLLRSGEPCLILVGGHALMADPLLLCSRISNATGAVLCSETSPAHTQRGVGVPSLPRLPYRAEDARRLLMKFRHLILVDAKSPVAFFAYPGQESSLVPSGCSVHGLVDDDEDVTLALLGLVDRVAGEVPPSPVAGRQRADCRDTAGRLTVDSLSRVVGDLMPEAAITVDESVTASASIEAGISGCARHDALRLTGGAIGLGLPMAIGAAIACPDRPVIVYQADGSAMYTPQALWTMARERLDVTVILLNNRSYSILKDELRRVGAGPAERAGAMLDLTDPAISFSALAGSLGVDGVAVSTTEDFAAELRRMIGEPGPHLLEAVL